jgi:hypothetical protein
MILVGQEFTNWLLVLPNPVMTKTFPVDFDVVPCSQSKRIQETSRNLEEHEQQTGLQSPSQCEGAEKMTDISCRLLSDITQTSTFGAPLLSE